MTQPQLLTIHFIFDFCWVYWYYQKHSIYEKAAQFETIDDLTSSILAKEKGNLTKKYL
jgi:hypothetical protein